MAGIKITGLEKPQKKLGQNASVDAIRQVVRQNGGQLQRNMMRKSPVDTGNMRRSVHMAIEDSGLTVVVGPTAEYAPYVEYGTRFMSAQPFVRPALEEQKAQFVADLKKLMK